MTKTTKPMPDKKKLFKWIEKSLKDFRSVLEGLICTEVNKRSKYHTKEDKLKSSEMWNKATDLLLKAQT